MRYPNAAKGVSKIFVAEILVLIATLTAIISVALAGNIYEMAATGAVSTDVEAAAAIGGGIGLLSSVILPIIAEIVMLVGLWQAGRDEPSNMKKAFWAAILVLIVAFISGVIQGMGINDYGIANIITSVLNILVFVFTIQGISLLSRSINRPDIASLGNKVLWMVIIVLLAALIIRIIGNYLLAASIISIIALVISLVAYIAYLVFLGKAKNALRVS